MPLVKTTVLAQQQRQGTLISASRAVPAGAIGTVIIQATIGTADQTDPTKSVKVGAERWDPVDSTWKFVAGMEYIGGPPSNRGYVDPGVEIPVANLAGKTVRLVVDIPVEMMIGGAVSITT